MIDLEYNDNFLVTVLLTVYNRPSVKDTIDSVLAQTFKNFQLLIIDNHSNDGTFELLEEYSKKDSRIKIVRNDSNLGQTYSLHKGMSLATGKFIARIDADDLMAKDRLKKQYDFLINNSEYGFCGSWVQFITDDNRLAFIVKTPQSDKGLRVLQKVACGVYHPSVMIRKSVLIENKIQYNSKLKMAEDYDMWRQLLLVSKGLNLPEVLTFYRRGNDNDSENNRLTTRKEDFSVRELICNELSYPGKSQMLNLIKIESKDSKSIFNLVKAMLLYRKYLLLNLSKNEIDYFIVRERILSRFLGEYIVYNDTWLAKFLNFIYNKLRKAYYKRLK